MFCRKNIQYLVTLWHSVWCESASAPFQYHKQFYCHCIIVINWFSLFVCVVARITFIDKVKRRIIVCNSISYLSYIDKKKHTFTFCGRFYFDSKYLLPLLMRARYVWNGDQRNVFFFLCRFVEKKLIIYLWATLFVLPRDAKICIYKSTVVKNPHTHDTGGSADIY